MGDERRINQLTAKAYSDIGSSDYFAVDNASEAESKKLPASAIKNGIDDASTTANTASTNATRALNIARSTSSFPTGDAYSSLSAYKVGDMAIYNNTLYRCKTACSAASWSVNANNFEAISLASAITDLNNDLNKCNIGNYINISSYRLTAPYTAPSDGYFMVGNNVSSSTTIIANIGDGNPGTIVLTVPYKEQTAVFVRKGTKLYTSSEYAVSNALFRFYPLE